jgi:hypothetical protein
MAQEHYKRWEGTVNTRPVFSSDANLNAPAPEVQQVDFIARVEEALSDLNQATDVFEGDNGKTAAELVAARQEVHRITAELNASKQRLQALEAKGSALDAYNGSVYKSEGTYQKLVELFTNKVQQEILASWYCRNVSVQAISKERKQDLRLHKRIQDLQQFKLVSQFERNVTPAQVAKKANVIGGRLLELKAYFEANQSPADVAKEVPAIGSKTVEQDQAE